MEVLQGVARDRYKQDLAGAFRRGALLQGIDLKGNTEINGMATAAFGPGTGANIQSTEWHPQLMHNQILFALASWPAP
jgi:hypothetical protein